MSPQNSVTWIARQPLMPSVCDRASDAPSGCLSLALSVLRVQLPEGSSGAEDSLFRLTRVAAGRRRQCLTTVWLRATEHLKQKPHAFYNLIWKRHPITSAIFYSLEVDQGDGITQGHENQRWRLWGGAVEAACHIKFSYIM